ncbi:MAG: nucleotidyltransferase family protein [Myxococcales bacterium]|nr:nucleotidyltransferase family protein [Myxococcales bacterium]
MDINQDFSDLFAAFNASGVEYLVVGAHALAAHGHVRATKDIDVWIRASSTNAPRVIAALKAFGAPLSSVSESDFAEGGLVFQIGVAPVRIDILTEVDGLDFGEAWTNRVETAFGEQPCFVLSKEDLIKNKRASGRPQDLVDIERLENE